jgi:N-acetylglutamate synthase-like GNAT family acetyltransferase
MEPMNLPKGSEKDNIEAESYPFIVTLNERIVATARLHTSSVSEGRIGFLAVENNYRKKRIASKLMLYIEGFAISLGLSHIIINVPKTTREFFEKLNYEIIQECSTFFEQIELLIMRKKLS